MFQTLSTPSSYPSYILTAPRIEGRMPEGDRLSKGVRGIWVGERLFNIDSFP